MLRFVSGHRFFRVLPQSLVLIALAGVNMAVFHVLTWPSVAKWDTGGGAPTAAKVAGAKAGKSKSKARK